VEFFDDKGIKKKKNRIDIKDYAEIRKKKNL
jgi:hypothetical protein